VGSRRPDFPNDVRAPGPEEEQPHISAGTRATVALLVVGLLALVGARPASAKKPHRKLLQPLNQYVVSGKVNTDELARGLRPQRGVGDRQEGWSYAS
jgi:hypothetical protein